MFVIVQKPHFLILARQKQSFEDVDFRPATLLKRDSKNTFSHRTPPGAASGETDNTALLFLQYKNPVKILNV